MERHCLVYHSALYHYLCALWFLNTVMFIAAKPILKQELILSLMDPQNTQTIGESLIQKKQDNIALAVGTRPLDANNLYDATLPYHNTIDVSFKCTESYIFSSKEFESEGNATTRIVPIE